jgi:hypothetical protein
MRACGDRTKMEHIPNEDESTFVWVDGPGDTYFDLSTLTYDQFTAFFFDRPIVAFDESYGLFRGGVDYFVASDPTVVVSNLRSTCRNWAHLREIYSYEQMEQGSAFALFGLGIECQQFLLDPTVSVALRLECVESMYFPFADVVRMPKGKNSPPRGLPSTMDADDYFMWWDSILFDFWHRFDNGRNDYSAAREDLRLILGAIHRTLEKILQLPDRYCQLCALHGLGHLHHPLVGETLQAYVVANLGFLSESDLEYIKDCRVGNVQ